jgi:YrbI family 3-deoxy-D-manno-octulosonate 8-phosphate phosphatase
MKYGLGYLKGTANLGDDIWAYAAAPHLPHMDYLIDYRNIDKFYSKDGEDVAMLLSGFIMTVKTLENQFFPAFNIIPKFISSHFRAGSYKWLSEPLINEYLKSYSPIGARDYYTMNNLKDIGVDAYWSGCITLTLDAPNEHPEFAEQRYICLVDVGREIEDKVRKELNGTGIDIRIMTHKVNLNEYSVLSWDERTKRVREYLDIYANAHCVITSRLHVALPCLAMETPVLVLKPPMTTDDFNARRFIPYIDLCHFSYYHDYLSGGGGGYLLIDPPPNKPDYLAVRNKLKSDIAKFINECETGTIKRKFTVSQAETDNFMKNMRIKYTLKDLKLVVLDVDGTLTDGSITYGNSVMDLKSFNVRDGLLIDVLPKIGIQVLFCTGRKSEAVSKRAAELGCELLDGIKDKSSVLSVYLSDRKLLPEDVAYIGDDVNDYAAMQLCGFRGCPSDASQEVKDICDYVSPLSGGHGAVRDIIEYLLKYQKVWGKVLELFKIGGYVR